MTPTKPCRNNMRKDVRLRVQLALVCSALAFDAASAATHSAQPFGACADPIFIDGFDGPPNIAQRGDHVAGVGATAFVSDGFDFLTFDVSDPGVLNLIGGAQGTGFALGFVDGDFTQAYGIDRYGTMVNSFATISTGNGAIDDIGTANPSSDPGGWTGFKQDPSTGTLYASATSCGSSSHLYAIDRHTGSSTLVGELSDMPCAVGIAVASDGAMYGIDVQLDALFSIDKTNGTATLIGATGINTSSGDIDFDDSTGILYYATRPGGAPSSQLHTLDLATGAATLVGAIPTEDITGLAIATPAVCSH
ncbi:MAG: DUF4394 domain-containing protein [Rhodanobacteraceae bacterium]